MLVEPIGGWVMYLLNQARAQMLRPARARRAATGPLLARWRGRVCGRPGACSSDGACSARRSASVPRQYDRAARRRSAASPHAPGRPARSWRDLAHPFYTALARGGEGHLEVGKNIYYTQHDRAPHGAQPEAVRLHAVHAVRRRAVRGRGAVQGHDLPADRDRRPTASSTPTAACRWRCSRRARGRRRSSTRRWRPRASAWTTSARTSTTHPELRRAALPRAAPRRESPGTAATFVLHVSDLMHGEPRWRLGLVASARARLGRTHEPTRASGLLLGIDVGSTAVKAWSSTRVDRRDRLARLPAPREPPGREVCSTFLRARRARDAGLGARRTAASFVTGSAGAALAPLIGRAVRPGGRGHRRSPCEQRHPDARAVVELGGQDAKIIVFEETARAARARIVSMNDKCAGGTGAVIDKIAAKLRIPPEALGGPAATRESAIHPVAGKCGVFAETDINGLQKRGVPRRRADGLALRRDRPAEPGRAVARAHAAAARAAARRPERLHPRAARGVAGAHRRACGRSAASPVAGRRGHRGSIRRRRCAAHFGALGAIEFGRREDGAPSGVPRRRGAAPDVAEAAAASATPRGAPALAASRLDLEAFRAQSYAPAVAAARLRAGASGRGLHRPRRRLDLDQGRAARRGRRASWRRRTSCRAATRSRTPSTCSARCAGRSSRRAPRSRCSASSRPATPRTCCRTSSRADAALVETVAHAQSALQLLRRPARHRRRRRPGHQDHRAARRPGEGLPPQHAVLGRATATSCRRSRRPSACPVEAVRRGGVLGARDAGSSATAACCSCSRRSPTSSATAGARGGAGRPRARAAEERVPLRGEGAEPRAPRHAVRAAGRARSGTSPRSRRRWTSSATASAGRTASRRSSLHPHCGEAGAIGAALEAIRLWRAGRATTFIGLDAAERIRYRTHVATRRPAATSARTTACARSSTSGPTAGRAEPPTGRRAVGWSWPTARRGAPRTCDAMRAIKAGVDAVKATHAEPGGAGRRARCGKPHAAAPVATGTGAPAVDDPAARAATRIAARRAHACGSASRASSTCTPTRRSSAGTSRAWASPPIEHRLLRLHDARSCTAAGATRGAIDPVLPVEGRAGARAQPAAGEARAGAAGLRSSSR